MKTELLSPAGSFEALKAAVSAGADAVYLGGSRFGARAYAPNFQGEELTKAIDFVHLRGKKIYLTLNTLLKDQEIESDLYDYLLPAYKEGIDALIVQDWGGVNFVAKNFPKLPIHASTQMAVMSKYGAKILKQNGISRIVTPRELSMKEILEIRRDSDIEIESFVHGAMCYSYSGLCLMSSILGGRSGNRGRCAQPCRLPYSVRKEGVKIGKKNEEYPLSPKDICTLEILPDILKAGISSLKIEGRMKSAQYTGGVTAVYRKYLDMLEAVGENGYHVNSKDLEYLESLYSRNGFSEGYYKQHNSRDMISLNKSTYSSDRNISSLVKDIPDIKRPVNCKVTIKRDNESKIEVFDLNNRAIFFGKIPESAQTKPLDKDYVQRQIMKTGGSDFVFDNIEIEIEDGLFMIAGDLNALRRGGLEVFQKLITDKSKRAEPVGFHEATIEKETDFFEKHLLSVNCLISTKEQFEKIITVPGINTIYLDYASIDLKKIQEFVIRCHENHKKIFLAFPPVFRKAAAEFFDRYWNLIDGSELDGYLVKNIDTYGYIRQKSGKALNFDTSMYSLNHESEKYFKQWGAEQITLPFELNYRELKKRATRSNELVVYGNIPLMHSAGCVKNTLDRCDKKTEYFQISDRYKKSFPVKSSCDLCYNTIYNSQHLSLLGVADKVKNLNIRAVRIDFTNEPPDVARRIAMDFMHVFTGTDVEAPEMEGYTRGHFNRGIE